VIAFCILITIGIEKGRSKYRIGKLESKFGGGKTRKLYSYEHNFREKKGRTGKFRETENAGLGK